MSINPLRVFLVLCGCIAILLSCYVVIVAVRLSEPNHSLILLIRLFDLDAEANIPTYFSVLQLALAAVLLGMVGQCARQRGDRFARHWLILAAIFWFLSIDELAQLHESLNRPLRTFMHVGGMLHYAWVIPYGVCAVAVGIVYVRFLMHLPTRTRWLMASSALIYVGGAIGIELYGGYLRALLGYEGTKTSLAYMTEVFFEEGMEMFGIALFIYTLLIHIQATMVRMQITIGPTRGVPVQTLQAPID